MPDERVLSSDAKKEQSAAHQQSQIDELGDLKKLWENDLSWLLESLYLIRYLTRHLIHGENLSEEDNNYYTDDIINKAKEKARVYVNGLLCEQIE